MSLTKIGSIGINTGIQLAGVTTVATLHVGSGVTLSSDGDVFATGISTFSEDIKVGSGVTISPDGDGFYTGVVTATTFSGSLAASNLTGALPAISGANLTNLNASNLASGTVPTARLGSGTASSSTFLRGDSTFATVTSTTINNNASTKFITGSDSANTLDAESNLSYNNSLVTFASSNLSINKSTSPTIAVKETAGNKEGQFRTNTDGVLLRSLGTYPLIFHTNQTARMSIDSNGHLVPAANDTYDLGSTSLRWRDIFTGDLNLSNEGKSNDVDGTWGNYTIQEGESDLFLINNRTGKKYKFNLTEVS